MKFLTKITVMFLGILIFGNAARAGIETEYDRDVNYANHIRYDRYLDVEIWTDDDRYYEGDNIQISFRADRDCFVAIYNVDTRGRVNLIYPASPWDDHRIEGDRVYTIPDRYDDYDLTVNGPEGVEYLHIVASRKPLIIPDWFDGSGVVCHDDPYDFIDYIDAAFFDCEDDCRRAFDMTSFVVEEWHDYYFRPVYVHDYHHHYDPFWDWGLYGAVYIDYPFGATIYIDGVYWGIAPLYIPRVYYGWHYITVYDHYGYCWEDRINIFKRKEIVLDRTIINTRVGTKSRFKEVREKGYLDPIKNGYPEYTKQVVKKKTSQPISKTARIDKKTNTIIKNEKSRTVIKERRGKSGNDSRRPAYKERENSDYDRARDRRSKSSTEKKSTYNRGADKTDRNSKSSSGKRSGSYDKKDSKSKTSKNRESKASGKSSKKSNSSGKKSSGSTVKEKKSSSDSKSNKSSSFSGSQKRSSTRTTSSARAESVKSGKKRR